MNTLFDINHTANRRNESWNSVKPETVQNQLHRILTEIAKRPTGLTSRQLEELTGIERTSVTRTLATYADMFDVERSVIDQETRKRVTAYRLSDAGLVELRKV